MMYMNVCWLLGVVINNIITRVGSKKNSPSVFAARESKVEVYVTLLIERIEIGNGTVSYGFDFRIWPSCFFLNRNDDDLRDDGIVAHLPPKPTSCLMTFLLL